MAKRQSEIGRFPTYYDNPGGFANQGGGMTAGEWEPPTTESGTPLEEYELFPGVFGYAIEESGRIYIPLVRPAKEGNGDVGKFLNSVSPRCVFPNVISPRLRGMLERRGFIKTFKKTEDGPVDVWRKNEKPQDALHPWDCECSDCYEADGVRRQDRDEEERNGL